MKSLQLRRGIMRQGKKLLEEVSTSWVVIYCTLWDSPTSLAPASQSVHMRYLIYFTVWLAEA